MLGAVRRSSASCARLCSRKPTLFQQPKYLFRDVRAWETPQPLESTLRYLHSFPNRRQHAAIQEAEAEGIEEEIIQDIKAPRPPTDAPVTRFADLHERNLVCRTVVRTLTSEMGLDTMTEVQSKTINETLKGLDVYVCSVVNGIRIADVVFSLAQAKTGTGKTLAFLIPVLQRIITVDPALERRSEKFNASSEDIRAIIISPTRELAEQIAVEAKRLVQGTGVVVQTAVGGSEKKHHLDAMRRQGCHILVGTPGRLSDILGDDRSGARAPNLSAFVLDEADRLLDIGFAPEIEKIQSFLPNRREVDRQTLLFSATVPAAVMGVVRDTMKPDFKFVRTVQEGEQQTHEKVPQKRVIVRSLENMLPAIMELCKREIARSGAKPFKAIIYFGATAEVTLAMSTLLGMKAPGSSTFHQHPLHPAKVYEIHSKLTQAQRTRSADNFRKAKSAILLSSDVTARGMDFPDVTHVIQVGLPQTTESYIHRLGRTARAGKEGEGWLFLNRFETRIARNLLEDMHLEKDTSLETADVDMTTDAQLPQHVAETLTQLVNASKGLNMREKAAAYTATLGYNSKIPDTQGVVDALNARAKYLWGMDRPPGLSPMLVNKMGLSRIKGIEISRRNFDSENFDSSDPGYGSSRGGFSGSAGRRSFGDRGSFRDRSSSFGRDREDRPSYGRDRNAFGGRPSYRDRESPGGRGGYGGRRGYGERGEGGRERSQVGKARY